MPFRILKIKFPKGAWRKPLFYFIANLKAIDGIKNIKGNFDNIIKQLYNKGNKGVYL